MSSPPRLWADPAAREPERAWLEPQPTPLRPAPDPGDEGGAPPPRRARRYWVAAIAAVSLLLAGVTGAVIAGGGNAKKAPAALPAATGNAVPQGRIGAIYQAVAPGVVQVRTGTG